MCQGRGHDNAMSAVRVGELAIPTRVSSTGPKVPALPSATSQLKEGGGGQRGTKEVAEKEDAEGRVSSFCTLQSLIHLLSHSPIHSVFHVSICSALSVTLL